MSDETVLELAEPVGHQLPADDAKSLGRWFAESADQSSSTRCALPSRYVDGISNAPGR